jgi:hypothetical protein
VDSTDKLLLAIGMFLFLISTIEANFHLGTIARCLEWEVNYKRDPKRTLEKEP